MTMAPACLFGRAKTNPGSAEGAEGRGAAEELVQSALPRLCGRELGQGGRQLRGGLGRMAEQGGRAGGRGAEGDKGGQLGRH